MTVFVLIRILLAIGLVLWLIGFEWYRGRTATAPSFALLLVQFGVSSLILGMFLLTFVWG